MAINMRVLLTGTTGSIGSATLKGLVEAGHEVTCPVRSVSRIPNPISDPLVHYIELDSAADDFTKFNSVAQGFACIIHTGFAYRHTDDEMERNVTRGLLEAAKSQAVHEKVVFIFTTGCHIVGEQQELVGDDAVSSANSSDFSAWRIAHEELAMSYASENLAVAVVRPCWVYGGSTVDQWFVACKKHNKIVIPVKNGRMAFVHKEDLATVYRLVAEGAGRGFYIASEGLGPDMEELVQFTKRLTGVETVERVENVMEHVHDYSFMLFGLNYSMMVESKRAREEFGFVPKHNLVRDEGRGLKLE